ncbi:thermonuclease family protein [Polluticoccus soli]|uniref:thermonuclease family protein n=1 Tax=Polluticoccus soli TaxID=3034150 RepID=UPI0023E15C94|nr:thermonuclease family protein [Flavipsychrobacter sp. JY13-12]
MRSKLLLFLLVPLLFIASCEVKESDEEKELHEVTKVIDGDTFWIDDNEKVRLIGVDAPESRNTGHKKIGYYGKEAKEFLKSYLTGKRVQLKYDVTRTDKYQRTLAYVYLEDGTFLNAELIKLGYAMVYTVPPNVKYADQFLDLQREARENSRGLWGKEDNK